MFTTLGAGIARRARLVLAVSLVALIGAVVVGIGVFGPVRSGGFDDPRSASSQAAVLVDRHFGGEPNLVVLVHARTGTIDTSAAAAGGAALVHQLRRDPRLSDVVSYSGTHSRGLESIDHTDALIVGRVVGRGATADENAAAVLASYSHVDTAAVTVRIGGAAGTGIGVRSGRTSRSPRPSRYR